MSYIDGIVKKTKSGLFVRYDKDVGLFVFSPYTGLMYGVHKNESDGIYNWLEHNKNITDEIYINTIGIGFKKKIEDASFGLPRLLPELIQWSNISFSPKPLVINWLITGKCTHNCNYCYAADVMWKNTTEPNENDIKDIIDNILVINPLVVVLTGGEPLLSPYLNIIIESLAGRVGLIIDTNGYVFSQEQLKIFKDKQIVVRISIDSQRPKVNDRYRPVIGDKKKQNLGAKKAIDLLNNCLDKDIASIVHTVTHRYNINDLSGMGEKFVCLGVKVWRILRLSPANDKPNINKVLGYDEDKYFHFYQEIIKKALNDWDKKMQVIIQENLYRERNSVILVSPSGNFMTESPLRGSGKIIIDPNNPKKPQKNELASKINWWAHYNRYLNFE